MHKRCKLLCAHFRPIGLLPSKCDWIIFSIHQYEPYGGRIFLLGNVYSVEMFLSRIPIDLYGGYDAIVTSVGMDKRTLRLRRRGCLLPASSLVCVSKPCRLDTFHRLVSQISDGFVLCVRLRTLFFSLDVEPPFCIELT